MTTALIILGAGKGTRMNSDLPKVLHPIGGAPMPLERIVEFKDATDQERAVTLCNSGVIMASSETLFDLIAAVGNDNAAQEYYLTDIIAIARSRGLSATVVACDEAETLGVNSRAELIAAEADFQRRARATAIDDGVTLTAPDSVYFAYDTVIGRDTVVEPNVVFGTNVTVESGARIRAFSHLEGCHVARGASVGPYARLRPGAVITKDVPAGALGVSRARQDNKAGFATRMFEKLKSIKAKQAKGS